MDITHTQFQTGLLTSGQKLALSESIREAKDWKIEIDDKSKASVSYIRRQLRRMKDKGIKLVIIDQLLHMDLEKDKETRLEALGNVTKNLKALAKEEDVCVVLVHQISRKAEDRGGSKMPELGDLKDTGAVEEDADLIFGLFRPEYYGMTDDKGNDTKGKVVIRILKQREGPTGDLLITHDGAVRIFKGEEKEFDTLPF